MPVAVEGRVRVTELSMEDDPLTPGLAVAVRTGDRVTGVPVAVEGRVGVTELKTDDEVLISALLVGLRPGDTVTEGVPVPKLLLADPVTEYSEGVPVAVEGRVGVTEVNAEDEVLI